MKTINNILSVLFFLLIAVACTSESDTMLNDIEKEVGSTSERVAMFDFSFTGLNTRSSSSLGDADQTEPADTETSTEASISNCFIAAIDNDDNVLASVFYDNLSQSGLDATIGGHMIIKVNKEQPLRFVAVANLYNNAKVSLLNCTTLNAIYNVPLVGEHPNTLVKVGISESISNYKTSDKILNHEDEGEAQCTTVKIPVTQRAAAIELAEFNVENAANVTVNSLRLLDFKEQALVKGEKEDSGFNSTNIVKPTDTNERYPNSEKPTYGSYDKIRFYSYDNSSVDNPTSLEINYTVDGVEYSRVYEIKTNGVTKVVGGNLYKLYVTVSTVDHLDFVVEDWTPNVINLGTINGSSIN